MSYYTRAVAASRNTALARAAMEARYARLWKESSQAAARLAAADQARKEGDVTVASRMYMSLARATRQSTTAAGAKQRLADLATEAREKLGQIDTRLAEGHDAQSRSRIYVPEGAPVDLQPPLAWEDLVATTFREYDQLAESYGSVPAVKHELSAHVRKQRHRPEFAAVLDEPEARTLWELAQQHEQEDQACCAYWVYRQAARLAPAPSGQRARDRFARMEQDPQLVASAETCRELQECHKLYRRAERLTKARPGRARELFAQIVQRAPDDSEVFRAAKSQISETPQ